MLFAYALGAPHWESDLSWPKDLKNGEKRNYEEMGENLNDEFQKKLKDLKDHISKNDTDSENDQVPNKEYSVLDHLSDEVSNRSKRIKNIYRYQKQQSKEDDDDSSNSSNSSDSSVSSDSSDSSDSTDSSDTSDSSSSSSSSQSKSKRKDKNKSKEDEDSKKSKTSKSDEDQEKKQDKEKHKENKNKHTKYDNSQSNGELKLNGSSNEIKNWHSVISEKLSDDVFIERNLEVLKQLLSSLKEKLNEKETKIEQDKTTSSNIEEISKNCDKNLTNTDDISTESRWSEIKSAIIKTLIKKKLCDRKEFLGCTDSRKMLIVKTLKRLRDRIEHKYGNTTLKDLPTNTRIALNVIYDIVTTRLQSYRSSTSSKWNSYSGGVLEVTGII